MEAFVRPGVGYLHRKMPNRQRVGGRIPIGNPLLYCCCCSIQSRKSIHLLRKHRKSRFSIENSTADRIPPAGNQIKWNQQWLGLFIDTTAAGHIGWPANRFSPEYQWYCTLLRKRSFVCLSVWYSPLWLRHGRQTRTKKHSKNMQVGQTVLHQHIPGKVPGSGNHQKYSCSSCSLARETRDRTRGRKSRKRREIESSSSTTTTSFLLLSYSIDSQRRSWLHLLGFYVFLWLFLCLFFYSFLCPLILLLHRQTSRPCRLPSSLIDFGPPLAPLWRLCSMLKYWFTPFRLLGAEETRKKLDGSYDLASSLLFLHLPHRYSRIFYLFLFHFFSLLSRRSRLIFYLLDKHIPALGNCQTYRHLGQQIHHHFSYFIIGQILF